jgi:hypothetical protein
MGYQKKSQKYIYFSEGDDIGKSIEKKLENLVYFSERDTRPIHFHPPGYRGGEDN